MCTELCLFACERVRNLGEKSMKRFGLWGSIKFRFKNFRVN